MPEIDVLTEFSKERKIVEESLDMELGIEDLNSPLISYPNIVHLILFNSSEV